MGKTILVLGGTGLLGSFVARRLQQDGFRVRILARSMDKARSMFDPSFELVAGDATDAASVKQALRGCAGIHISLSENIERAAIDTVKAALPGSEIDQITYVSGVTVHEHNRWFPMIRDKLYAEEALRQSGIPYTIFRPTWFMEMLFNFIRDGRAFVIGKHTAPYHFLASADFARMVASAYQTEAAYNRHFYTFGPEAIPIQEALARTCAILYPQIESVAAMPTWLMQTIGVLTGNQRLKEASRLMAYFDRVGVETYADPSEANQVLGTASITLDQWLESEKHKSE